MLLHYSAFVSTADGKERVMADVMTFPNTWEEFEEMYSITDTEQIYTNGSRLIPTFRVRQWLDHMDALMNMDGVYDGTADTPQTDEIGDCNSCEYLGDLRCGMCTNGSGYKRRADTPQTDCPWE